VANSPAQAPGAKATPPEGELERLKKQAEELRAQMNRVFEKIAALEKKNP